MPSRTSCTPPCTHYRSTRTCYPPPYPRTHAHYPLWMQSFRDRRGHMTITQHNTNDGNMCPTCKQPHCYIPPAPQHGEETYQQPQQHTSRPWRAWRDLLLLQPEDRVPWCSDSPNWHKAVLKRNIGRCYSDWKPNVPLRNCIRSLRSQDLCK